MGIPATGKYASVTGITIERVVDGKIIEARNEWDRLGALQQLGALPAQSP
jgi:predicted ester cyclase